MKWKRVVFWTCFMRVPSRRSKRKGLTPLRYCLRLYPVHFDPLTPFLRFVTHSLTDKIAGVKTNIKVLLFGRMFQATSELVNLYTSAVNEQRSKSPLSLALFSRALGNRHARSDRYSAKSDKLVKPLRNQEHIFS